MLKIGRLFGSVIDVDLAGNSWKRFVRIRVALEVSAPLLTGFLLDREKLPDLWIPFKYEKLGNFCYGYGRIGHEVKNCNNQDSNCMRNKGETMGIFGNWLRADNGEFQPGIDLINLRNSDTVECSASARNEGDVSPERLLREAGEDRSRSTQNQLQWPKAVQTASDTWHEIERKEKTDVNVLGLNTSDINDNMGLEEMTVIAQLTGGKIEDNEELAMSTDDIIFPLANIDQIHHIPTHVGGKEPDNQSLKGPGLSENYGPNFESPMSSPFQQNIEVGLLISSLKRKEVEQEEDQSILKAKKAKVEGNMGSHLISPNSAELNTPPTMVKVLSSSKTAAKGTSPKSLARAKAGNTWRRTKKNLPHMSADPVAMLNATGESSPSSVQMAEEAGLITPHPSP